MAFKKFIYTIILLILVPTYGLSQNSYEKSKGETVYVSIYSHVYSGPKQSKVKLSSILSIRNTDLSQKIKIVKVEYYDTKGDYIESYIDKPFLLSPLETTNFYIKEYDMRGGSGAKFIVKWESEDLINQPVIESVMIGLLGGQGISFVCKGINLHN